MAVHYLKENKDAILVTKSGKRYPMTRYEANKYINDNGIEDFHIEDAKGIRYFYIDEKEKLKESAEDKASNELSKYIVHFYNDVISTINSIVNQDDISRNTYKKIMKLKNIAQTFEDNTEKFIPDEFWDGKEY